MKVKIVSGQTVRELETAINVFTRDGYTLEGTPFVGPDGTFYQTLSCIIY